MSPRAPKQPSVVGGFTLLELIAAMVVGAMLLTMSLQILGQSSATVKAADKQRNAEAQLRAALDRFTADFSSAMLDGGATPIWNTTATGSEIFFVCRSHPGTTSLSSTLRPRGAVNGYALLNRQQDNGGKTYDELKRGDGPIAFNNDLGNTFKQLNANPADPIWNGWEPLGLGIVRFHISFLLDDGSITQTPPAYSIIIPQPTGDVASSFRNGLSLKPGHIAIAATERNKQRPSIGGGNSINDGRYVKALIVAAAGVDRDALNLTLSTGKFAQVKDLGIPVQGETPLEVWQRNLTKITFPPLLQSIRFQQRTIPIQ
ncbi:MAG: type II secretion system protein [Verrucomicrobia bacterium]|jgi:prepilin-type N-terminal cleavage/methylation domain-containing protein|nr:type II secretion system protein [Verrucomicrobiota bacterium]